MSPPPAPPEGDRAVARLFGVMLMVVGGLIMTLSGLCSLAFVASDLYGATHSAQSAQAAMGMLPWVLIVGGIPFLAGLGVFALGRHLRRGPGAPP